jgi:hypothetical protein
VTDFATAADRLLNHVRHWEQPRWSTPAAAAAAASALADRQSRADRAFALVQFLADLAADAAQRPRRPVPREADMVLPDQIRVVADDLLAAGPPAEVLAAATTAIDAFRASL